MLKYFLGVLLAVNLGLFAFNNGYLNSLIPSGREPERLQQQLLAHKIVKVPAAASVAAVQPDPLLTCLEIGNFTVTEAALFERKLVTTSLDTYQSRHNIQDVTYYRVIIPSQKNKEGARKKVEELRNLNIKDFFIIQEGSNLDWGISLGAFKTHVAANARLTQLVKQGVRSAQITDHSNANSRIAFQLRNVPMSLRPNIDKIKVDFPDQVERECSAI